MKLRKLILAAIVCFSSIHVSAALSVKAQGGWLETCWMEFTGLSNSYSQYNAYVSSNGGSTWTAVDGPLVRSYGNYGRVDAVGLTPGTNYKLKVVPVNTSGSEVNADAVTSGTLVVKAHDRNGYAHQFSTDGTVGAYKNDGTLKANAQVLYITGANAKTVTMEIPSSSSKTATYTGLQTIINAYAKAYTSGWLKKPLAIRLIGTLTAAQMDALGSSAEGIQIKPAKAYGRLDLTIEGIGMDAAFHGFGFLCRYAGYVEFRNFGIINCMDDCMSLDTENECIWAHNIDFFYGQAGSDADQKKGDGTFDLKGDSRYITLSYCHFFDSGKSSLCGMKDETGENFITYHHNWFDHSDSRHPRIRTMSVHVYNNYYDGVAKYGVGMTYGGSAFVESNYFRACKYPMMISMQGTDAQGAGTFSSENGGVIKAYNNYMTGHSGYIVCSSGYTANGKSTHATSFDAYEVGSRNTTVPSSVKAVQGGTTYTNFDTRAGEKCNVMSITPDAPADVPNIVKGQYGAGRCQKGNIVFEFSSDDDTNYSVIAGLKDITTNYPTMPIAPTVTIAGDDSAISGGQVEENPSQGGGSGSSEEGGEQGGSGGSGEQGGSGNVSDTDSDLQHGTYENYFTGSKNNNSFYTITGNYSNSKGTATVNGTTYTICLKMESSTNVTFTTDKKLTFYLMMGGAGQTIKLDGTTYTAGENGSITIADVAAGSHSITRAGSYFLFYINAYEVAAEEPEAPVLSSEAELSKITVNGVVIPEFDEEKLAYQFVLAAGTTTAPTVAAVAKDNNAQVQITQASSVTGQATIVVTAEDGTNTMTYTVQFSVSENEVSAGSLTWNFSDAGWAAGTAKDGLTPGSEISIDNSSKSIDGINFTKRLKLGGTISDTKNVSFAVTGPCDITVYGMSSKSGTARTLVIKSGSATGTTLQADFLSNDGSAIGSATYSYTGEAATIVIGSTADGYNLYGINVVYPEPEPEDPEVEGSVIFSMTAPTAPTTAVAANGNANITATYVNGSAAVFNGKSSEAVMIGDGLVKLGGSAKSYMTITLTNDMIKAGDVISVTSNVADHNMFRIGISGVGTDSVTFPYTVKAGDRWENSQVLTFAKTRVTGYASQISSVVITRGEVTPPTPEPTYYTITWKNGDAVLATDQVEEGQTPSYTGETPVKAATAEYTYSFVGWTPTIVNATVDATYMAQFSQTANKYTLTWDVDGVTTSSSVEFGTNIVAPSSPSKLGYTFAGWSPAVAATMPAENVTYTATWTCNISGTIYSADNKAGVAGDLDAFHTKRATYPNAVMIIPSALASSIAADEENIILDYAVGTHGGHYYECQKFVLVDLKNWKDGGATYASQTDFYSPVDFVALDGSYSRPFNANGYNSACVPFDINIGDFERNELLAYSSYDENASTVYFTYQNSVNAGIAIIIYPSVTNANWVKTFNNTVIKGSPVEGTSFKGVFAATTGYKSTYYSVSSSTGNFSYLKNYLYAFRACFRLEGDRTNQSAAPEHLSIRVIDEEGIETNLDEIEIDGANTNQPTYSIDGKMVGEISAPGLYIVNGKIVYKH